MHNLLVLGPDDHSTPSATRTAKDHSTPCAARKAKYQTKNFHRYIRSL
jgi:hypothetical protein